MPYNNYNWTIIKSEEQYEKALSRLSYLMNNCELGTPEGDELELLGLLVGDYEEKVHPIPELDPIDAIVCSMEDMDFTQKDLARIIGDKSNTSKVLKRKRRLSLEMIRNIHRELKIPLDILTKDYDLAL